MSRLTLFHHLERVEAMRCYWELKHVQLEQVGLLFNVKVHSNMTYFLCTTVQKIVTSMQDAVGMLWIYLLYFLVPPNRGGCITM